MRPINLLTAVAAITMSATPTFAANWVLGAYGSDLVPRYYDADTMQRIGNQVTVWEKADYSRDKTVRFRETKAQRRYDCADRTSTLLSITDYYPDGTIKSFTYEPYQQKTAPTPPETIGEMMLESVCEPKAP